MAKTRVHELAKEFGVESKFVLEKFKEMGEFVKSASSTVELPAEMRFRKEVGEALKSAAPAASRRGEAGRQEGRREARPQAGPQGSTGRAVEVVEPEPEAPAAPEPVAAEPDACTGRRGAPRR